MPDYWLVTLTVTFIVALPGLVFSLGFGIGAWQYRTDPLGKIAALFALKPLLSTPLFALAMAGFFGSNELVLIMPGVLLSLLLVGYGFSSLVAHPFSALLLLVGDALRWMLPYLMQAKNLPLLTPAMLWTSGYAILCWYIAKHTYTRTGTCSTQ